MKSFIERKIDVLMALDGDTFDDSNNVVQLSGLRCQATIQSYSGTGGSAASQLQMRISGMKNADMAKLSTLGFRDGFYKKNAINVFAGDDASGMSLVFSGGITYANVDYNSMPDVGIEILAAASADAQYASIAANSFKGDISAASMLEAVARSADLKFQNNGVTAVLSNHAVAGTANDQIVDICAAVGCQHLIEGKTLYIWPAHGSIDDNVIDVGPDTGLVGYPRYIKGGLELTTIFNPSLRCGRRVKVTSSTPAPSANNPAVNSLVVPGANGTFYCKVLTHDLASQTPDAPWFSHMQLYVNADQALDPNNE